MDHNKLVNEITPILAAQNLELDGLEVVPAGKRSVLRVIVDGDGDNGRGPTLDEVAAATRAVSSYLDDSTAVGSQPFTLEVTTRGVSRPLTKPQHFRRNRDRLVAITSTDGERIVGRIAAASDDSVTVLVADSSQEVQYAQIKKALVQIEMNRADEEKRG